MGAGHGGSLANEELKDDLERAIRLFRQVGLFDFSQRIAVVVEAAVLYALQKSIDPDIALRGQFVHVSDDFFLAPVSWIDRQNFVYTADGMIKSRRFGARRAKPLHFRAAVGRASDRLPNPKDKAALAVHDAATSKFIIRVFQVFDGTRNHPGADLLIDGARIADVGPGIEAEDAVILDLGRVTVLPGYIDIYSALPDGDAAAVGAQLLAYGVTTLVSDHVPAPSDSALWDSEESPGPRLLAASELGREATADQPVLVSIRRGDAAGGGQREAVQELQRRGIPVLAEHWTVGLSLGADLLLGADTLPSSPLGRRYLDMQIAIGSGPLTLVSGLADAGTPGLTQLLNSRQARLFGHRGSGVRRFAAVPQLGGKDTTIVLGSKPNGLPPGLALHAELRALAAAGLPPTQVLQAMGRSPAEVLGVQNDIGVIAKGAIADLVFVAGDPLSNISDTLNIVAVMRNGRFFSLVSLLERAQAQKGVGLFDKTRNLDELVVGTPQN